MAALNSHAQQDKHFSMFSESPVFLNPATAGFSDQQLQLFTNFRSQWLTVTDDPYRTISASVDWRMLDPEATKAASFMGAGVNFYNDKSGISQYTTNIITFPINYALQVGVADHLSFGLQPAFYQRTINGDHLTWDSQWTGVEFDQGLSNNELLLNQNLNISRFDIGAGVYWRNDNSYIGLSVPNLLTDEHYDGVQNAIAAERLHYFLIAGKVFDLSPRVKFKPAVLGKFVVGAPIIADLSANFMFDDTLRLGLAYRWDDSVSGLIGLQLGPKLMIGYAYDATTTRLRNFNSGTHEIMLRFELRSREKQLKSPRFF